MRCSLRPAWPRPRGLHSRQKAPPAAQDKTLVVLLDRVEPEYKPGAKYRTPATIDNELAEDLARRMQMPLTKADAGQAAASAGAVRLQLTTLADAGAVAPGHTVVPVAYHAAPMAIMRTDTDITSWDQLRGRTVCVARGSRHAGMAAGRYGATAEFGMAGAWQMGIEWDGPAGRGSVNFRGGVQ